MINDTLHIGDIVVGAKQPFSTENRQSYLILNFAEHIETGNALIVYQEVYTGKIRCGLLETFMAKTELLLANNFCFSQACITLGEKHKFYPGDIVRHFKRETVNEDELSSGKYLYEILYYAEYLEEDVVVYRALDALAEEPFKVWVRPVKMFESEVDMEKYPNIKQQHRFELALRRTNNSTIMMNH